MSSTSIPFPRPSTSRVRNQTEVIASSNIIPIPLRERTSQLVISEKSIQICIEELRSQYMADSYPILNLTEPAFKLVQTEVTYRLFYLLRVNNLFF